MVGFAEKRFFTGCSSLLNKFVQLRPEEKLLVLDSCRSCKFIKDVVFGLLKLSFIQTFCIFQKENHNG